MKTVMSEMGMAMMGTSCASGRTVPAGHRGQSATLLEDVNLQGARASGEHHRGSGPVPGRYSDVGNIIEQFARARHCEGGHRDRSDMRDELTSPSRHRPERAPGKPVKVVDNTVQGSATAAPAQREQQSVNYRDSTVLP